MTASESREHREPRVPSAPADRSIADRALDAFVYLPAGVLMTAWEDMPEMTARGKARLEQELRNAQVVGRFTVDFGWRQLKEQLEWVAGERRKPASDGGAPSGAEDSAGRPRPSPSPPAARRGAGSRAPSVAPAPVRPSRATSASTARDPGVDRAIPDYDILSASQVVRRLDGLGPAELRAVVRHERATRGRRTILHRGEQLLSAAGTSGPTGSPSAPGPHDDQGPPSPPSSSGQTPTP